MKRLIVFVPLVLSACAQTMEPRPTVTQVQDETVLTSTASTSNTLILDKNTDFITCTTPAPDATFSQTASGSFDGRLGGNDDQGNFAEGSTAAGMPGRSPAVLMTRELFFRTCEFSRNYGLTKAEAYDLYLKTMHIAASGWRTEGGRTTVTIGESQTPDITRQTLVVPGSGGDNSTDDELSDDGF